MATVKVGQENSAPIELYYEDAGTGDPIVLIHGWPLNGASWEKQIAALLAAGKRVITYDRRGFGQSSKPSIGYNYDTLAADLEVLLSHLNLRAATLVGFSMGTGEVARYLGKYGSARISKAVLIGVIPPFLLKTDDNPEGVAKSVFDGIEKAIKLDRPAFLLEFLKNFYNWDKLGGSKVSEQVLHANWAVAIGASPKATLDCVASWLEDFRADVARIDVPTLIIHGDADQILPFDATARRLKDLIKGAKFVELKDGPHGLLWTHAEDVNKSLLNFLG